MARWWPFGVRGAPPGAALTGAGFRQARVRRPAVRPSDDLEFTRTQHGAFGGTVPEEPIGSRFMAEPCGVPTKRRPDLRRREGPFVRWTERTSRVAACRGKQQECRWLGPGRSAGAVTVGGAADPSRTKAAFAGIRHGYCGREPLLV